MLKRNKDIYVNNWDHLQELIFKDSFDKELNRFRSPYVFRGLSNEIYELKTSLIRLENDPPEMEKHLFRNFKKYAPKNTIQEDNDWLWLSIAQHHGLPTRLLDWTFSPYIALHFICENLNHYHLDGVIWCVDFYETTKYLPKDFKDKLDEEKARGFDISLLKSVCPKLSDLRNYYLKDGYFIVFFEPPSINERIINQFALFSFMSDPVMIMNDWLNKHEDLYFRLIIPSKLKWEIRDKLDQINITERMIYPGLDGLST